jgi:hypothetical protein
MESCPQAGNVIATNSREQTCERKRVIGSRFLSNDTRREFHLLGRQRILICRRHNAGMIQQFPAKPPQVRQADSRLTATADVRPQFERADVHRRINSGHDKTAPARASHQCGGRRGYALLPRHVRRPLATSGRLLHTNSFGWRIISFDCILGRSYSPGKFDDIDINAEVFIQARASFEMFDRLTQLAQTRRIGLLREISLRREFARRVIGKLDNL